MRKGRGEPKDLNAHYRVFRAELFPVPSAEHGFRASWDTGVLMLAALEKVLGGAQA